MSYPRPTWGHTAPAAAYPQPAYQPSYTPHNPPANYPPGRPYQPPHAGYQPAPVVQTYPPNPRPYAQVPPPANPAPTPYPHYHRPQTAPARPQYAPIEFQKGGQLGSVPPPAAAAPPASAAPMPPALQHLYGPRGWKDSSRRAARSRSRERERRSSRKSKSRSRSKSRSKSRSRSRSRSRDRRRRRRSSPNRDKCFICSKAGHIARQCPTARPQQAAAQGGAVTAAPGGATVPVGGTANAPIKCRSLTLDLQNMPPHLHVEHVLMVASYFGPVLECKMGPNNAFAEVSFVDADHARLMMDVCWEHRLVIPISWASHLMVEKNDPSVQRVIAEQSATRTAWLSNLPAKVFEEGEEAAKSQIEAFLTEKAPKIPIACIQVLSSKRTAFVHFCDVKSAVGMLVTLTGAELLGNKLVCKFGKENTLDLDNPNYPPFLEIAFPFVATQKTAPPPRPLLPPFADFATVWIERFPSTGTLRDAARFASRYGGILDARIEEHMERCVVSFADPDSAWTLITEEAEGPAQPLIIRDQRVKIRWASPANVAEHRLRDLVKQESKFIYGKATRSLWIGNLAPEVTESDLATHLLQFFPAGYEFLDLVLLADPQIAMVSFPAVQEASALLTKADRTILKGTPLTIRYVKHPTPIFPLRKSPGSRREGR